MATVSELANNPVPCEWCHLGGGVEVRVCREHGPQWHLRGRCLCPDCVRWAVEQGYHVRDGATGREVRA